MDDIIHRDPHSFIGCYISSHVECICLVGSHDPSPAVCVVEHVGKATNWESHSKYPIAPGYRTLARR